MFTDARPLLLALPGVSVRRLTNREGFFTAGRMFALLGERSLLLRLPELRRQELFARARGRPLVDDPVPSLLAWIELPLAGLDPDEVARLAAQSREAVRQLARSGRSRPLFRRRRRHTAA